MGDGHVLIRKKKATSKSKLTYLKNINFFVQGYEVPRTLGKFSLVVFLSTLLIGSPQIHFGMGILTVIILILSVTSPYAVSDY